MRGVRTITIFRPCSHWITPACAGSTSSTGAVSVPWGDHPRVCGEYGHDELGHTFVVGSPPRVRGVHNFAAVYPKSSGITPACAGSTSIDHWLSSAVRDHPRVCGEYSLSRSAVSCVTGSPPRVRGVPAQSMQVIQWSGITPACAGSTGIHTR